ncbi:MAG: hypothetical protein WCS73_11400 [Lentisphaeria bacterium]
MENYVISKNPGYAFIHNWEDFLAFADKMKTSGMYGFTNVGQECIVLSSCMATNTTQIEYLQTYNIIQGKISMKASVMLAKFHQLGGKYTVLKYTAEEARARFVYKENDMEMSFTMEDAKKAGLTIDRKGKEKDNYKSFAANMLWSRLTSNAMNLLAPEISAGMYTPEVVEDFDKGPAQDDTALKVETPVGTVLNSETWEQNMIESEEVYNGNYPKEPVKDDPPEPKPTPKPEQTKDEPQPIDEVESDPLLCPAGKVKGEMWKDLPTSTLSVIRNCKKKSFTDLMSPAHYKELDFVLKLRGDK